MSAKKHLLFILFLFAPHIAVFGGMMARHHMVRCLSVMENLTLEKVCELSEGNRNVVMVLIDSLYSQDIRKKKEKNRK